MESITTNNLALLEIDKLSRAFCRSVAKSVRRLCFSTITTCHIVKRHNQSNNSRKMSGEPVYRMQAIKRSLRNRKK